MQEFAIGAQVIAQNHWSQATEPCILWTQGMPLTLQTSRGSGRSRSKVALASSWQFHCWQRCSVAAQVRETMSVNKQKVQGETCPSATTWKHQWVRHCATCLPNWWIPAASERESPCVQSLLLRGPKRPFLIVPSWMCFRHTDFNYPGLAFRIERAGY